MENHTIPIDSIFRNYKQFSKSNPFIYYLPDSLKNISYARLSSIELPKILPQFTEDLGNNTFEIARDLPLDALNNIFVSENITLTEGFYEKNNLLSNLSTYFSSPTIVNNFKIELITTNGFNQIKISADESFSLNFGSVNHAYQFLSKDIIESNVSLKDSKKYTGNNIYYDSVNKNIFKYKINTVSSLNGEETSFLDDKTNIPILSNNTFDLNGNKKNFNIRTPPLGYYLGFRNKFYSGSNVYYSEAEPETNIMKYLLVKVNNYGKTPTNHGDDEYLAKIIVPDQEKGTFDNESNLLSKRFMFSKPEDIEELKISLHDPYGNVINLNNQDFSMTVELGVIKNSDLKNKYLEGFP